MGNASLNEANKAKNDEFYTQISDIERECAHYEQHFKDKIIFCNCDDPDTSSFWRYFHIHFGLLGLKRLVSTHFVYEDMYEPGETYKMVYEGGNDGDYTLGTKTALKQNGDFRSAECREILKSCDIVVTNPPFSLFREYVAQLVESEKQFLIIGSTNAIAAKEIYKFIKDNKFWLGYGFKSGDAYFGIPSNSDTKMYASGVYDEKTGLVHFRNVSWYTNMDIEKRHEDLILYKKFNEKDYQKYDDYDAINVNKVAEIPTDYDGLMGVPITFLDKYNPDQFEFIGIDRYVEDNPNYGHRFKINGKETYARILIKRK